MNLTDEEIAKLEGTKSEDEWTAACKAVKDARDGQYPPDWYARVLGNGFADRVFAAWGTPGSTKIQIAGIA